MCSTGGLGERAYDDQVPLTDVRRRDVLRVAGLSTAALMATAFGATACADGDPATPAAPPTKGWGAFIPTVLPPEGSTVSPIAQLTALAGVAPRYLHRFASIRDSPPIAELDAIIGAGATPLLTLEPWNPDGGIDQPLFALSRVAAGAFDGDLRRWGTALAAWDKPLLFRFAQEMNGTWYPWAVGRNGNTAADYVAAWLHVRSVVVAAGARHVRFVWAPNVITSGTAPFLDMYPGHDTVDVIGLDGYNWGDVPGHHWQSPPDLFSASLDALHALDAARPILITEVASAEGPTPDLKARWIRDFLAAIKTDPRIESFVWFQMDKERDWRFNTTPQSTAAFRAGLAALAAPR